MRNRLIAGLCLGVLVVEGTETSGSLITARWALEQGRDVFAVPGGIDAPLSRGPNGLIRRGEAKLIQDAWDVVEEYQFLYPETLHPKTPMPSEKLSQRLGTLQIPQPPRPVAAPVMAPAEEPTPPTAQEESSAKLVVDLRKDPEAFAEDQLVVLRALQGEVRKSSDQLVEETGIPARRVMSALTLLQVRQLVDQEDRRFGTVVELVE